MSKTNGDEEEILRLLSKGYTVDEVHQKTGISPNYLYKNFAGYIKRKNWKILGHKSEAYYKDEDKMLHDPVYTYNDLSPSEKEIYDNLNKGEL
jgi:hypothetical protein